MEKRTKIFIVIIFQPLVLAPAKFAMLPRFLLSFLNWLFQDQQYHFSQ